MVASHNFFTDVESSARSNGSDKAKLELRHESLEMTCTLLYLTLDEIRRDGGTQPRAAVDLKHVKLLEQQMEDGQELEPVTVFYDGESYWLADGFHRFTARRNQEREAIACIVRQGTRRDAVLYSVGANAENKPALPRSREDKRRAVLTLLQDPEWGKWSDREIARYCKVDNKTVGKIRERLTEEFLSNTSLQKGERTYTTKHGTVAQMKTANIGKGANASSLEQLQNSCARVTVAAEHPLFPNRSGTISQVPNSNAAVVELDTGERELIALKHLKPTLALHLKLDVGGLVEVHAPDNDKVDGRVGRIATIQERNVEVWLRDVATMTMHCYSLKPQQLTPLPLEQEPQMQEIGARIAKLRSCQLDPFEQEILLLLERPIVLTPTELEYLIGIEKRYGIVQN
ncbi:hypothetical protein C7B80_11880 [Cyanosarcina cf. burmensis CCALA 770]|nr:hypothetical protein C7B80_11880 [Cyanosarcina cf. burmensis CCALA 770]